MCVRERERTSHYERSDDRGKGWLAGRKLPTLMLCLSKGCGLTDLLSVFSLSDVCSVKVNIRKF